MAELMKKGLLTIEGNEWKVNIIIPPPPPYFIIYIIMQNVRGLLAPHFSFDVLNKRFGMMN